MGGGGVPTPWTSLHCKYAITPIFIHVWVHLCVRSNFSSIRRLYNIFLRAVQSDFFRLFSTRGLYPVSEMYRYRFYCTRAKRQKDGKIAFESGNGEL